MTFAFGLGIMELLLILILLTVPSLIALIDILRHDFKENQKLIWLLLVLFLPLAGTLVYFIAGKKQQI